MRKNQLKSELERLTSIVKNRNCRKKIKEKNVKDLVERLLFELSYFLDVSELQENRVAISHDVSREAIYHAIGYIYRLSEQHEVEVDPSYFPLIPKKSRYFTQKASGRLAKLIGFNE